MPVESKTVDAPSKRKAMSRKKFNEANFLLIDDMDWFCRAFAVTKSKGQFAVALLIYRLDKLAQQRESARVASNVALGSMLGINRGTCQRAAANLERAGLIRSRSEQGTARRVWVVHG
jgi:DNA-binding MarR family transcriptional regulator